MIRDRLPENEDYDLDVETERVDERLVDKDVREITSLFPTC